MQVGNLVTTEICVIVPSEPVQSCELYFGRTVQYDTSDEIKREESTCDI